MRKFPASVCVALLATTGATLQSLVSAQAPTKVTNEASSPAIFSTLGEAEKRSDNRLQKSVVDVVDSEIYIADLLAQISQQTGVTLTVSSRYHTGSWKVCASLKKQSLADTMNALRSAMS
ncbi:MAG: hypothetical protein H7Y38_17915, partial [Armatimonadetes bacterium]|nr:hypothetical protein [Armatimonadota bacterium]